MSGKGAGSDRCSFLKLLTLLLTHQVHTWVDGGGSRWEPLRSPNTRSSPLAGGHPTCAPLGNLPMPAQASHADGVMHMPQNRDAGLDPS